MMDAPRRPAQEVLEIEGMQLRKTAPIALDLNGIAKGYGVDRLAETLRDHGIADALVGIDGEMRAMGLRPDGEAWIIAVEAPDLIAGRRIRFWRCRTPPWRPPVTTAIGSRFRGAACRIPWIRDVARR